MMGGLIPDSVDNDAHLHGTIVAIDNTPDRPMRLDKTYPARKTLDVAGFQADKVLKYSTVIFFPRTEAKKQRNFTDLARRKKTGKHLFVVQA